jgi:hypothetical protein
MLDIKNLKSAIPALSSGAFFTASETATNEMISVVSLIFGIVMLMVAIIDFGVMLYRKIKKHISEGKLSKGDIVSFINFITKENPINNVDEIASAIKKYKDKDKGDK